MRKYSNAHEIVWCQEEPQNQGSWYQIRHGLQSKLDDKHELLYAGRAGAAAPATGIAALHEQQQKNLVSAALQGVPPEETSRQTLRVPAAAQTRTGFMTIEVRVPQLPESVADATLVSWHKKPGDSVVRDENLVDLETDKVVFEVPAPVAGVIKEIKLSDGTTVTSGQILAVIDETAAAVPGASAPAIMAAPAALPRRPRRTVSASREGRGR